MLFCVYIHAIHYPLRSIPSYPWLSKLPPYSTLMLLMFTTDP